MDAAAIAAHYGSVSAVTFIAATNYLKSIDQPFENYATAFLPVMEAPAILVGVVLGKMAIKKAGESSSASLRTALHETLFGRRIFLLVGALGVLSASASYIAAPAAIRISLPEANLMVYLTSSLAITFPFKIALGIPIYFEIARPLPVNP